MKRSHLNSLLQMKPMAALLAAFTMAGTASAQFALPPVTPSAEVGSASASNAPASNAAASDPEALFRTANNQLTSSKLTGNQLTATVGIFHQIKREHGQNPKWRQQLGALRAKLIARGIDVALLDMKLPVAGQTPGAKKPQPLGGLSQTTPPAFGAAPQATTTPTTSLDARLKESKRLVALGRAALDRGDVSQAYQLATQAKGLGVEQNEFAANDVRPWQLLLDVQSAARTRGMQLPVAQASAVQTAGGVQANPWGQVAQAGGTSPIGQNGGIMQVQAELPDADAKKGADLYEKGMKALAAGNKSEARASFVEAWKYESSMDLGKRRSLQDKLTLLQPTRLGAAGDAIKPLGPIEKAELEAQQQVTRLYREVTAELAKANENRENAPMQVTDDLSRLQRRVAGANVDEASRASLGAMVSRAINDHRGYVEKNRAKIDMDLRNEAIMADIATKQARRLKIDDEVTALVETFNDLMDEQRYPEAEVIAKQVGELLPGSPIAQTMRHSSRMQVRLALNEEIRAGKEDGFLRTMLDLDRTSTPMDPDRPFLLPDPQTWEAISERRLSSGERGSRLSPEEQVIKERLETKVEILYENRPFGQVLDDLSKLSGVPIVMDRRALDALQISDDTPITQNISSRIPLRSALNIMLGDLDLTYVIRNDVLSVTSRQAAQTMVETRTYRVADLVTPIPNFISSYDQGLAGALKSAYQMINPTTDVQVVPVSMAGMGGMADASPASMGRNMLGQYNAMGPGGGFAGGLGTGGAMQGGRGGGSLADFTQLMNLIQQTVEPDSWEALGGVGTMAEYPQNLSLVISTTSDVHDQIVDLLESLRRLQNLQITIEVRFITLADNFFEQIGIDFDVRFDDNVSQIPNDDSGPAVTIGLDAQGIPTPDLDIRLDQNTVGGALPPFGGDAGAISTIGFAILSDIEAFFFLQAAQGDNRSNIMQAPKVTLFDGQIASIIDNVQRPFVTSIVPVVGDFAVAQQPVIVVLDEGTKLNVQGVVSDDKRFVRLTLVPTFSQIGDVNTFTYEGSRTTRSTSREEEDTNGDGVIDANDNPNNTEEEDVIQGTTVQQPTFAQTTVSTTVSVPDGGTILLGGIKRLSEGRNERGVPFLSKIPYVSRLFRNVGIGRTSTSLMLMVTPRIIIQEEEEIAQTGFDPRR